MLKVKHGRMPIEDLIDTFEGKLGKYIEDFSFITDSLFDP